MPPPHVLTFAAFSLPIPMLSYMERIQLEPVREGEMEFLNFVLIFVAALLLLRKPEKERLAFRLVVASTVLMVVLFSIATRTSLLPGVNY